MLKVVLGCELSEAEELAIGLDLEACFLVHQESSELETIGQDRDDAHIRVYRWCDKQEYAIVIDVSVPVGNSPILSISLECALECAVSGLVVRCESAGKVSEDVHGEIGVGIIQKAQDQ
jgi:hypothetical protein